MGDFFMIIRAALLTSLLAISGCAQLPSAANTAEKASSYQATSSIIGSTGTEIGKATLTGGPNGVLVRVEVLRGNLSPGWHGIHFHQIGDCSDVGVFKKSGGHVGLIEGGHGLLNPIGPEAGDIPNIFAHADGSAGYEIFTDLITQQQLLDTDGTALVIHANEDDHISQPIGGAGPRIACGVIK